MPYFRHPTSLSSLFSAASTKLMLLCFASTVHNAHLICVISDLLKQRCNHELGLLLALLTKTHNLFLYLLFLKNIIAFLHLIWLNDKKRLKMFISYLSTSLIAILANFLLMKNQNLINFIQI